MIPQHVQSSQNTKLSLDIEDFITNVMCRRGAPSPVKEQIGYFPLMNSHQYDAIVVGSGISGGWAAKELCEKGLKTLVLERGRQVEHLKDYF